MHDSESTNFLVATLFAFVALGLPPLISAWRSGKGTARFGHLKQALD